ncbi:MAG: hypothetical protein D0530_10915 [Methylococcales bacterium]|nr:MAG: hypothetical protein D0530_10915 [Methylococcales bacterium]
MLAADSYTAQNLANLRMQASYRMIKLFEGCTSSHKDYPEMQLLGIIEIFNLMFKNSGKKIIPIVIGEQSLKGFEVVEWRTPENKSRD